MNSTQYQVERKMSRSQTEEGILGVVSKDYLFRLQLGQFTDFSAIKNEQIFHVFKNFYGQAIISLYACRFPNSKKAQEEFQNFLISKMHPIATQEEGFHILFFNTSIKSHEKLSEFYSFYHTLPINYYTKLLKLFIIHPSFVLKSWQMFLISQQNKILKEKVVYIEKISQLEQFNLIDQEIYAQIPSFIKAKDKTLLKFEKQKNTPVKAQIMTKITGIKLEQYDLTPKGIPIVLIEIVKYFMENPQFLQLEGIFRKAASIMKENQLEESLRVRKYEVLKDFDEPYAVAGILKKLFDKLQTNLITNDQYNQIIEQIKNNKNVSIDQLRKTLKETKYFNVILFSFTFFSYVTKFQSTNLMSEYNMAVVFTPCFIKPTNTDNEYLKNIGVAVRGFQIILEKSEEIFEGQQFLNWMD